MKYSIFLLSLFFSLTAYAQELTPLKKGDKFAFFLNDERVTDFIYDAVSDPNDAGFIVGAGGVQGFVNRLGQEIIPLQYDYLIFADGNALVAGQNGLAGVLDTSGNELLPFVYEKVDQYSASGTAVVKLNGAWGVLRNGVISNDVSKVVFRNPDTYPLFFGKVRKPGTEQEMLQKSASKLLEYVVSSYVQSPKVIRNRISGSGTVVFVISPEGKVLKPWVEDTDNDAFAEILVEIVRTMPEWSVPAMANGVPVAVEFRLPIEFSLK